MSQPKSLVSHFVASVLPISLQRLRTFAALAAYLSFASLAACSKTSSPTGDASSATNSNANVPASATATTANEGSKNLPTEANDLLKAQLDAVAKAKATASAVSKEGENMAKEVEKATK